MSSLEFFLSFGQDFLPMEPELRQSFRGVCYLCGVPNHNQCWCPLAQCVLCSRFGHSKLVCDILKKKATSSFNWREQPKNRRHTTGYIHWNVKPK